MLNLALLWVAAAVFAQAALTLGLLAWLGAIRLPMIARGEVNIRDIALSRDPWPEPEKRVSNALDNQFQLPVLFYLACGFSILMGGGVLDIVLAWAFVVSRYAHAAIFVTTNNVVNRFWAYAAGYVVLVFFWLLLALRLVAVGVAFGLH